MDRKALFYLSLLTLFGFSLVGFVLNYFFLDQQPAQLFESDYSFGFQAIIGIAYGSIAALIALTIIRSSFFTESRLYFGRLFEKINPKFHHILFYSFCAGVGEEILFRGAIQPHIGIWLTSLIFVLLHGYINPKNIALSMYGAFLIFVSSGFGYLFDIYGIIAPMAAHFIFDVILFLYLIKSISNTENQNSFTE